MPSPSQTGRRFASGVLLVASVALAGAQTTEITMPPEDAGDRRADPPRRSRPGTGRSAPAREAPNLTDRWFVELVGSPLTEGGSDAELELAREQFLLEARRAGLRLAPRHDFRTLWNGLSVRIDAAQVGALWRLPGVLAIHPVEQIELPPAPTGAGPGPSLADSVAWIGADVAQLDLGLSGAGVRVGIIDSGIDHEHPDLGGCFGPGCRIETGYDFIDFDDDPDAGIDSYHGTHVAGIVGANGAVTGVAPGVTFGDYRVCQGLCPTDAILAALERALADGMHVVNLSLGSLVPWTRDPLSLAADRLTRRGVVVVASAGNAGSAGSFAGSRPAGGEHVLSVASMGMGPVAMPVLHTGGRTMLRVNAVGAPFAPTGGQGQLVFCGRACPADALTADPAGRAALVERGGCSIAVKARHVIAAGATAVLVHDDRPGGPFPTNLAGAGIARPVTTLSRNDGTYLRGLGEPVVFEWGSELREMPIISSFSSYGPNAGLVLKPDIAAPGEAILSTLPLEIDVGLGPGYGRLSGTSMSAPHVTGAAALLLEARPHTPARALRTILMSTADPFPLHWAPTLGLREAAHREGAGMLDVPGALRTATRVDPPKLSGGEGEQGPSTHTIELSNEGPTPEVYDIVHEPAAGTGGVLFQTPAFWFSGEELSLPTEIAVAAGATVSVELTITAPPDPRLPGSGDLYGGYVAFVPRSGGESVRVPYLGFVGDYQAVPALDFGWLLPPRLDHEVYRVPVDPAYALVVLRHPARQVIVDLLDPWTGKNHHRVVRHDYVGLSASALFDGTTRNGGNNHVYEIPDGEYVMRFRILKALGDDDEPEHWEEWQTPPFHVSRDLPSPAHDRCADAEPIEGPGQFSFDNTFAATDGDPDSRCSQWGDPQVHGDVWYAWTARCTGTVSVKTCGLTDVDTKIAVYDGTTCPAGQGILDCNDDGPPDCNPEPGDWQSAVEFEAVSGRSYLIRIGKSGALSLGGPGSFAISSCDAGTLGGGRASHEAHRRPDSRRTEPAGQ